MKLEEFDLPTRKKCSKCERIIMNLKHNKCHNCYNEEKQNMNSEQVRKITEYHSKNKEMRMNNPGFVDSQKNKHITRTFSANPRGFGEGTQEKLTMLKLSRNRL